ncbi:MAG: isopenicillin N synthase family oxygenase [Myxococcales bacterium]|nr:isopenicillin N synthase family oxygenase [Myxococcales bacterium]MCB9545065.1 isopenicillin N synthase family oxygenase [Myxococcales bacterium]
MADTHGIPVLEFADYHEGGLKRATFVQELGAALSQYGFVAITGHGVDASLIDAAFAAAAEVFALPLSAKHAHERPECARQRGYTPFGLERAKGENSHDLKEFWHVGRDLPADHPFRVAGLMAENAFPPEVPAFARTMRHLFAAQERFALGMLAAIARYLGVDPTRFLELVEDGNSVLRVIHYPDIDGPPPAGSIRAAAHEDINLLTVLPTATRPGLQILTREGEWLDVQAPPGAMICDTGDMMALLTGGRLPATTHRVINPEGAGDGGRMSMPFFLHPHPNALLAPLDGSAPGRLARDFLAERLRDNGVG